MSTIPSMRPEPSRDHNGRYLLPGPDGQTRAWTRATTLVGALKDLNGLIDWKRRKVAEGLAVNPQLLKAVPAMAAQIEAAEDWRQAKEAKAAFNALCDQAADAAGANKGSVAGTQAHTLTEYADAGRLAEVIDLATDSELADLRAYLDACDRAGVIRPVEYIERIVINSVVDSAGTLDRLVDVRALCPRCGGTLRVADVKSQQSVDFGFMEICAQLAQYANADGMVNPDTGVLEPMPEALCRCTGIVMHAPVGSAICDIYQIDLQVGWEAAQIAHRVRQLRKESMTFGRLYAPPADVAPLPGGQAMYLVQHAGHVDALKALWRDLARRGQWTNDLTTAAAARKAELLATT